MKPRRNPLVGTLVVIALSQAAIAETGTWSGTATATWDTSATNWSGLTITPPWDATNGQNNTAIFNTASLAATVSGTVHTNAITFTTGGSLTGGVVTLAGTTPSINVATGQTIQIGNSTTNTDLAGSAGLVKTGEGILALGGAKTLTGGVTVNAGTLRFTTGGGVGSNAILLGDTTGSAAANLEWVNNSTATSASPVVVRSGSAGIKTLQVTSGVSATVSSLTLQDNVAKSNAGDMNVTNATNLDGASKTITVNSGRLLLNGAVGETSGTGFNLTKDGAATLVLAGTNTYTGTTTAAAGVLQVNKALSLPGYNTAGKAIINGGTLSVQVGGSGWTTGEVDTLLTNATKTAGNLGIDTSNGNVTQWTAFTDTNLSPTVGLQKLGSNSLILNLTNTYSGNTTITAGTLQPNDTAALPGYNTSGKIIFSGGILNLLIGGSNWTTGQVDTLLANASKTSGSLGIDTTNGNLTQWTPLSPTNLATLGLVKNGTNRLTLDQANTFTGGVTVNAGTLRLSNSNALGTGTKNLDSRGGSRVVELSGGITLGSNISWLMSSNSGDGAGLSNIDGNNQILGNVTYSFGNPAFNISSSGTGSLTILGNLSYSAGANGRILYLGGTSTNPSRIGGNITEAGGTSTAMILTKQGAGTWVLSGANTYTGVINVSAGTLVVQNNSALGTTAGGTTVNGGTLDLGGTVTDLNLPAEVITIHGTGVGGNGALVNNGSNDHANAVEQLVLGADATIGGTKRWDVRGSGTTFNMAGKILTKTGTNFIAFVGASPGGVSITNPGNVIINQGELNVHYGSTFGISGATNNITVNNGGIFSFYQSTPLHASTLNLNNGSTLRALSGSGAQNTWAGPINVAGEVSLLAEAVLNISNTVSGTANLTKTGASTATISGNLTHTGNLTVSAGTLVLSGTNSFSGNTNVNAGTLKIDCTNNTSKLPDGAALNLAGGTVDLSAGAFTEAVGSVNLPSGTSSVTRTAGTAVLQMNAITPTTGASINFGADSIATTDTPNTNGILGPWATVTAVGGTTWAVNSTGLADGLINGLATYTLSSVAGDTATNYAAANISIDSDQTLDAAATPNSLRFNNAAANTLTLTDTNTIGSGGILVTSTVGNNLSSITGGSITGPANGDFVINQQNTANALTISSSIVNNGLATNLVKLGLGRAILSGTNTYSGTTTIGAGALQIDTADSLGDSTAISVSGVSNSALVLGDNVTAGSGKTVTIRGGGLEGFYGGISTTSTNGAALWEGNVVIGDLNNTRIGSRFGSLEVSGVISETTAGSALIVRSAVNDATVIFSGNNTFTGPLTVSNNGALNIRHVNALGSTSVGTLVGSGTTLQLEGGITFAAEPLNITGGGVGDLGSLRNMSGNNTFTGTITLSAQSRISSAADNLILDVASGPAITATNQSVIFSGDGNIALNDPIAIGTGAVTKQGFGVLNLNAANTYTGVTSFQGGIVNASSLTDYGVAGPLGARTAAQEAAANIALRFAGGTLQYTGSTAQSTNRQIRISTAGGTIDASGSTPSATVSFSYSGANTDLFDSPGTRSLTLTGTNAGDNTFAIKLEDQSTNPTSLTKSGSGKWVITNAHTYTGGTTINEGVLDLTGSLAAGSAVTVGGASATGTPTLSGTGTVNGSLAIAAAGGGAAGTVNPGTVGTTGTLKTGAATIAGTYTCDVSGANADKLEVSGNLDISGATLALTGTLTAPSYTIASYTGALSGNPFTSITGLGSYTVDYGTGNNSEIKIVQATDDYITWQNSFTPPAGAKTADDDGDGLNNFQEYAFGLNPKSGSSVNPLTQPLNKTSGTFKYTRRATPATTGVTYTYESSTTLSGAWSPVTPSVPDATNSATPVEEITVTVPASLLDAPKLFIRVIATKP